MKKIINNIFLILILFLSFSSDVSAYVRKKIKPNFFVPEADISTNSKYAKPKFGRASTDAVNMGIHKEVKYRESYIPAQKQIETPIIENQASENPQYQNKFQEYLRDVDQIKENGYVRESNVLKKDLSKMSSEERIRIDKKFNETRDVEGTIDSLIK